MARAVMNFAKRMLIAAAVRFGLIFLCFVLSAHSIADCCEPWPASLSLAESSPAGWPCLSLCIHGYTNAAKLSPHSASSEQQ